MYRQDLALNNPLGLIFHITQQTNHVIYHNRGENR